MRHFTGSSAPANPAKIVARRGSPNGPANNGISPHYALLKTHVSDCFTISAFTPVPNR